MLTICQVVDNAVHDRRPGISALNLTFHRFTAQIAFRCPVLKPQKARVLFPVAVPRTPVVLRCSPSTLSSPNSGSSSASPMMSCRRHFGHNHLQGSVSPPPSTPNAPIKDRGAAYSPNRCRRGVSSDRSRSRRRYRSVHVRGL